ncbi:MAG: DUF3465 domain-containing protein [Wenzhouxiangella sp.]|jgi:hypothetical protein|nr:DUF3465 domain-containing protein [Wenzhouxiangella sp.]
MLRRFGVVLIVLFATAGVVACGGNELPDNTRLLDAFAEGRTGIWVSGHGIVVRPLGSAEDNQRFLVRVDDSLSLVVRHRVGETGPVPAERDDTIAFQGRYDFHGGGGELVLTHADPAQPGGGGWIELDGKRYQ